MDMTVVVACGGLGSVRRPHREGAPSRRRSTSCRCRGAVKASMEGNYALNGWISDDCEMEDGVWVRPLMAKDATCGFGVVETRLQPWSKLFVGRQA
jgi:hypothetical protein